MAGLPNQARGVGGEAAIPELGVSGDREQVTRRPSVMIEQRFTRAVRSALAFSALTFVGVSSADELNVDFESFALGSPNGQAGWTRTGNYDHMIVDSPTLAGTRSLRISNAVTSGSFGDHTFSAALSEPAGETGAEGGLNSGPAVHHYFRGSWDFKSATPDAEQPGLAFQISPDRGDGARMSYVGMRDASAGLEVLFYDYQAGTAGACNGTFQLTTVASGLNRSETHSIEIEMTFVDGRGNDVVTVTVNGTETHTGTSWEDYFRDCESNPSRTVDSLAFLTRGTRVEATSGKGFLIDNVQLFSGAPPDKRPPVVTNVLATPSPVAVIAPYTFTALAEDADSNVASAGWWIMDAANVSQASGAFTFTPEDSVNLSASLTAPSVAGLYAACVDAQDDATPVNSSDLECTELVVYDPSGGFVTGGGWIDSPANAMAAGIVRDGTVFDDSWVFNAEPPFVTPAYFSTEESSSGIGSLAVIPITNTTGNQAKFILRYVPATQILLSDLQQFSIDFLIDGEGTNLNPNQFYINLYTLTPDPADGSWYDCRFDYVATSGSTTYWTALSFDPTTVATNVGSKLTSGSCPSSLSGMPAGSAVLFLSVNLGDTSANDTGSGGFFDNARMTVAGNTTIWDLGEGLVGKANFGFVSKYQKGASVPTGTTQFTFKAGDLGFHSNSYDWLVVNQAGTNAQYKGEGRVNDALAPNGQPYKFMLWAGDGATTLAADTFRIKIWYEDGGEEVIVYDNGTEQAIAGGQIIVHTGKKK